MVLWAVIECNAMGRLAMPLRIEEETGLSQPTIWRALRKLEKLELIFKRQHGRYQANTNSGFFKSSVEVISRVEQRRSMF